MILFAGDPHGEFGPIIQAVREKRPEGIILLGDHDLERPLEIELGDAASLTDVWWIPGNHDTDRERWFDNLFNSGLGARNLSGQVRTIGGLRVAGLGGIFRGAIWHPEYNAGKPRCESREVFVQHMGRGNRWRGGLPLRQHSSIWWEDYERLCNERADVLVCHEAPSCHPRGFEAIDELAQHLGARLIVHGHHHTDYSASLPNGTLVIGVGLAGVTNDQGKVISFAMDKAAHRLRRNRRLKRVIR